MEETIERLERWLFWAFGEAEGYASDDEIPAGLEEWMRAKREADSIRLDIVRRRALSKLTEEERKALHLE